MERKRKILALVLGLAVMAGAKQIANAECSRTRCDAECESLSVCDANSGGNNGGAPNNSMDGGSGYVVPEWAHKFLGPNDRAAAEKLYEAAKTNSQGVTLVQLYILERMRIAGVSAKIAYGNITGVSSYLLNSIGASIIIIVNPCSLPGSFIFCQCPENKNKSECGGESNGGGGGDGGAIVSGGSVGGSIIPTMVPPAPKPQPAPAPAPVASPPPTLGYCSAWACGQNGNAFCANWIGPGTPPTKYCSDLPQQGSGGDNGGGSIIEGQQQRCSGFNFAHIACQGNGCIYDYGTQHCNANTSNCQQERVCNSTDSQGNGTDCSFQEVCH